MFDATVQAAIIVIVAAAINYGAKLIALPITPETVNSIAAVLVGYIFSKIAPPAVRSLLGKNKAGA